MTEIISGLSTLTSLGDRKFETLSTILDFLSVLFLKEIITNKNDNIHKSEAYEIRWSDKYQ